MQNRKNSIFDKYKKYIRLFGSLSLLLVLGKVLGLVKQMVVSATFGTTIETDLITIADGFIGNTDYVISGTLVVALGTVYIHSKAHSEENGKKLLSDSFKGFTLIVGILALLIVLISPLLASILAPTYQGLLRDKLILYIRVLSPIIVTYTWSSFFTSVLNANNRFIPGQCVGINQSLIIILIVMVFSSLYQTQSLLLGYIVSACFNCLFVFVFAKKYLFLVKGNPFKNPEFIEILRLVPPLLLSYSMIFINQQVDKIIVSGMEAGSVTALGYGSVLTNFISTFVGIFCTVLFTRMASSVASGNIDGSAKIAIKTSNLFVIILIPISIISFICSKDIVAIVFGRGAFDAASIERTALALSGYCISFPANALKDLLVKFQYGNKETKWPSISNSIGIVFNIVFSIILCKKLGIFGVAIASGLADYISMILNIIIVNRKYNALKYKYVLRNLPIWAILTFSGIFIVLFVNKMFGGLNVYIRFVSVAGVSLFIYFIMVLLLNKITKKRLLGNM